MGIKESDMPSIVLTKEEHKKFTEAWKNNAARNIYKDYHELLKAVEESFK